MEIERRNYDFEFRAEDGETPKIVGYGAVFGKRSENLGGFVEVIEPGAFDAVLGNDVRALWNHNPDFILGRTVSGTMRLSVDETGLRYEIDADSESSLVRDLVLRPMMRGDVTQSSFGFTIGEEDWTEVDGVPLRTIRSVSRLFDVSPVAYPAYPDASVALRRLEQINAQPAIVKGKQDDIRALIEALSDEEREALAPIVAGQALEELSELRAENQRHLLIIRALRAGGGLSRV